ncbi:hypothetical protein Acr_00g0104390 [Actinidia rufa]|uniref:Uncharacterized protein n=1 Tax=Actinidia rufa TaxID=165716 RepID=A0A7J0E0W9_9ERIC|nr:hypothetical protein Acr_00g0104390 [Actinidia rufa]
MSTTRLMVAPGLTILQIKPCFKSQSFIVNSDSCLENSKHKDGSNWFGGLRWRKSDTKRGLVVYSSVEPGISPPNSNPNPNSCNFSSVVAGSVFCETIDGSHGKNVEAAVETAEHMTEVIEKVAEEVEKLADDIADELPEGGKLRDAIETVENAAKETVKYAQFVEDIIDKVCT